MVVSAATLQTEDVAGVLLDKYNVADGLALELDVKGESKAYTVDTDAVTAPGLLSGANSGSAVSDWVYAEVGEVVKLSFDAAGDVSDVDELQMVTGLQVKSVSVSANRVTMTTGAVYYANGDTLVYDVTGDSPVSVGLEGLAPDDMVRVYVGTDGYLDFVVIYEP